MRMDSLVLGFRKREGEIIWSAPNRCGHFGSTVQKPIEPVSIPVEPGFTRELLANFRLNHPQKTS
jgi:hypothetical protein